MFLVHGRSFVFTKAIGGSEYPTIGLTFFCISSSRKRLFINYDSKRCSIIQPHETLFVKKNDLLYYGARFFANKNNHGELFVTIMANI